MGDSNGPPPVSRTLTALTAATRVRKAADGGLQLAEVQIPLVEGVKGMDAGYLFGEDIPWGGERWDLIIHPMEGSDHLEYTVRQSGKDEDTGFIIRVPHQNTVAIILKHGFVFNRRNPLPAGAENGQVIMAQDKQVTYLMSLPAFIAQVMEVAGITADPDGEQPHLLVEVDEEGEGDALTPA